MKEIKNISNKVISVYNDAGELQILLPDSSIQVNDKMAANDSLLCYEQIGLLTIKDVYEKAVRIEDEDEPIPAVEEEAPAPASAPAAEEQKGAVGRGRGRNKDK